MRSTCSVYVDVGYLLAAAATRVTGTSLRSGELPKVKLRLGRFGVDGQQKGVEGRAHGVSRHLVRAADELEVLDPQIVDRSVMKVEA